MNTDILVLGGGASGLAAAICAKDKAPSAKVSLIEALPRVGKKLLATGNGRCNIMNANASAKDYFGDKAFSEFALDGYMKNAPDFWRKIGLTLTEEAEGRMYPRVNQASAVLDALRLALKERNIEEITSLRCEKIKAVGGGFELCLGGDKMSCRRVIVCTGGMAGKGLGENDSFIRLLKPLGHAFTGTYPALSYLKTEKAAVGGLKGVRLRGEISLLKGDKTLKTEKGEMLFREDGISGICAMQLSLIAAPLIGREKLKVRLSPMGADARNIITERIALHPSRAAGELLTGEVNRLIAQNAMKRAGINVNTPAGRLNEGETARLSDEISNWTIELIGTGSYADAQVMLGGADTGDFDPTSMESRKVKGLYAAGELLNVTGPCGGYNLSWAWASGMLAGERAAESL